MDSAWHGMARMEQANPTKLNWSVATEGAPGIGSQGGGSELFEFGGAAINFLVGSRTRA